MQNDLDPWSYSTILRDTSTRSKVVEEERFEEKSQQYVLEKRHELATEATVIPTSDVTSELFEYDITGARVRAYGQATGGYLREVAENEEAFSYSLQDVSSLYVLHKIATSDKPVDIQGLEELIQNGSGWLRIALLVRGGLLDMVGSELRATERGRRELETIFAFSRLQGQKDD